MLKKKWTIKLVNFSNPLIGLPQKKTIIPLHINHLINLDIMWDFLLFLYILVFLFINFLFFNILTIILHLIIS